MLGDFLGGFLLGLCSGIGLMAVLAAIVCFMDRREK